MRPQSIPDTATAATKATSAIATHHPNDTGFSCRDAQLSRRARTKK